MSHSRQKNQRASLADTRPKKRSAAAVVLNRIVRRHDTILLMRPTTKLATSSLLSRRPRRDTGRWRDTDRAGRAEMTGAHQHLTATHWNDGYPRMTMRDPARRNLVVVFGLGSTPGAVSNLSGNRPQERWGEKRSGVCPEERPAGANPALPPNDQALRWQRKMTLELPTDVARCPSQQRMVLAHFQGLTNNRKINAKCPWRARTSVVESSRMKNQKSNDERINGKLHVSIYAHPTDACPDRNDPSTAKSATVVGLDAARAWLTANGGYASIKADYSGVWISGWSVYRVIAGYGHRCAGYIQPLTDAGESL